MLDSFEITGFKEEVTQEEDETRTVIKIQKAHAGEWMLLEGNIGERLSIDETLHCLTLLGNFTGRKICQFPESL